MTDLSALLANAQQLEQHLLEQIEGLSRVLWQTRGRIATLKELMETPDVPPPLDPPAPEPPAAGE